MATDRLNLALRLLEPGDWRMFEEFATSYLAPEFPELRPTASSGGDRGRDAQLFTGSNPVVTVQLSVAADWRQKLRDTAARVTEAIPSAKVLIFVTNQDAGAAGQDIGAGIGTEFGLFVDVRDRNWIVAHYDSGSLREVAGESLIEAVLPRVEGAAASRHSAALSGEESRVALTFLEIRWADDTNEKGLTRLAFEALTRAALRSTNNENRLLRPEVTRSVHAMVPTHRLEDVSRHVDAALGRLSKRAIRHWRATDEFCLSFEERANLAEQMAALAYQNHLLELQIRQHLAHLESEVDAATINDLTQRVEATIELYFAAKGEAFAQAVVTESNEVPDQNALTTAAERDLGLRPPVWQAAAFVRSIIDAAYALLTDPSESVHQYLNRLSDSYTLRAFLEETPDVQAAVSKMFSHGRVWLDSSIVLPILADTLQDHGHRHFSVLIDAARQSGLELFVTAGVIEEVERHLNRTLTCARTRATDWQGDYPYLYARYLVSGRSLGALPTWIETFIGRTRPEEDLQLFLDEAHGITTAEPVPDAATGTLWAPFLAEWQRVHTERRGRRDGDVDPMLTIRLARHDAETHVGLLMLRAQETASQLGYSAWWLTLDREAWPVHQRVIQELGLRGTPPPIMSADFLRNYLAFGPRRRLVPRSLEINFPVVANVELSEYVPKELAALAAEVRARHRGLPERVIQRRVRDELDQARMRRGRLAQAGLRNLQEELNRVPPTG